MTILTETLASQFYFFDLWFGLIKEVFVATIIVPLIARAARVQVTHKWADAIIYTHVALATVAFCVATACGVRIAFLFFSLALGGILCLTPLMFVSWFPEYRSVKITYASVLVLMYSFMFYAITLSRPSLDALFDFYIFLQAAAIELGVVLCFVIYQSIKLFQSLRGLFMRRVA
jgi:hypothetical protein